MRRPLAPLPGRLAGSAGAHDGHDLAGLGTHGGFEAEAGSLHHDLGVEHPAGHRCAPGRQARTSSSTATAVTSSSSDSATAVPCETPAPLKAV